MASFSAGMTINSYEIVNGSDVAADGKFLINKPSADSGPASPIT